MKPAFRFCLLLVCAAFVMLLSLEASARPPRFRGGKAPRFSIVRLYKAAYTGPYWGKVGKRRPSPARGRGAHHNG